jgi:hypothetical protein
MSQTLSDEDGAHHVLAIGAQCPAEAAVVAAPGALGARFAGAGDPLKRGMTCVNQLLQSLCGLMG